MTTQQTELFQRIQNFDLDDIDAKMPFSKRLARDNGWTIQYTQRVIDEYKKFVFLAIVSDHPVTPSDEIDQVWHLHLLYTRSYWDDFCPNILQQNLHHHPTKGGTNERIKFNSFYNKTLANYQLFFSQVPPSDIWKASHIRFGKDVNFVRANTQENWILPKPHFPIDFDSLKLNYIVNFLSIFLVSLLSFSLPVFAQRSGVGNSFANSSNLYLLLGDITLIVATFLLLLFFQLNTKLIPHTLNLGKFCLVLFVLNAMGLIFGMFNLSGYEFLAFYCVLIGNAFVFDISITQWMKSKFSITPESKDNTDLSWEEYINNEGNIFEIGWIDVTFLVTYCLHILGAIRTYFGLSNGKPMIYISLLALFVGAYILWIKFVRTPPKNKLFSAFIHITVFVSNLFLFLIIALITVSKNPIYLLIPFMGLILVLTVITLRSNSSSSSKDRSGDDGGCSACGGCGGCD